MKRTCGIYQITCKNNNKIYIGSSKNIERRWRAHVSELRNNKHKNMFLQKEWNEFGENAFDFEILEETSLGDRYNIEQSYLKTLMPFYRLDNGYNINENSQNRNSPTIRISRANEYADHYIVKRSRNKYKMLLDYEDYINLTREEIESMYDAHCTYNEIRNYILDMNGYDDDWA